jgi:hypothetical protein
MIPVILLNPVAYNGAGARNEWDAFEAVSLEGGGLKRPPRRLQLLGQDADELGGRQASG